GLRPDLVLDCGLPRRLGPLLLPAGGGAQPGQLGRRGCPNLVHCQPPSGKPATACGRQPPVQLPLAYRSSESTFCGRALACASMATPACCRIWARVRLAVSAAKSASRMRERAAERFSELVLRLAMVDSKRLCTAPSSARNPATWCSAESTVRVALDAASRVATLMAFPVYVSVAFARPLRPSAARSSASPPTMISLPTSAISSMPRSNLALVTGSVMPAICRST